MEWPRYNYDSWRKRRVRATSVPDAAEPTRGDLDRMYAELDALLAPRVPYVSGDGSVYGVPHDQVDVPLEDDAPLPWRKDWHREISMAVSMFLLLGFVGLGVGAAMADVWVAVAVGFSGAVTMVYIIGGLAR